MTQPYLSSRMRAVLDVLVQSESPLSESELLHALPVAMRPAGGAVERTVNALRYRGYVQGSTRGYYVTGLGRKAHADLAIGRACPRRGAA